MKRRLAEALAWLEGRSQRERALLVAAWAGLFYALFGVALMAPVEERREALRVRGEEAAAQLRGLEQQAIGIEQAHTRDPDLELRRRREEVAREIAALDAGIHERTASLVSPPEMARLLEQILSRQSGLRLRRLESLAPEPLLAAPAEGAPSEPAAAGVFKHGFVIELEGGYLAALAYLEALESLPWEFFWESFEYESSQWPEGKATLRAFTLSSQEGWIGA